MGSYERDGYLCVVGHREVIMAAVTSTEVKPIISDFGRI